MKKLLSIILFVLLCCYAMAYDFSAVCSTGQTLYYNITSDVEPYTVEVTSENTDDPYYTTYPTGDLEIPETVLYNSITYSVTSIGDYAFSGCSELTSVTIPESVTSIGNYAFDACSALMNITCRSENPPIITSTTFSSYDGITLHVPVDYLDAYRSAQFWSNFANLEPLPYETTWTDDNGMTWTFTVNGTEATDIKSAMTTDRYYIYGDPNHPEQVPVTLPGWDGAAGRFGDINGLYFPTISDEVYFGHKTLIFEIIAAEDGSETRVMNGWWTEIYAENVPISVGLWKLPITEAIANDCAQGGLAHDLLIMLTIGTVTIKSVYYETTSVLDVVAIPTNVYVGSTELTVTSICDYAFRNCSGLTEITIPNSVTSIGSDAFSGCNDLETITVESGNTIYDSRDNCNAIIETATNTLIAGCKNTVIPNSVTDIDSYAFSDCSGLTEVIIPNSVISIGEGAFSGCSGLTELTIGNSVTSIGDYAFWGCSGLESIIVESENTKYDSRDNCNAIIETATNTLIVGCKNTIIPSSVTSINDYAFRNCNGLTEVTIPNSVTSIGIYSYAFFGCSGLESITVESGNTIYDSRDNCNAIVETATNKLITGCKNTIIPSSVTSINDYAFLNCSGLTEVIIPDSVTSIGSGAFLDCSGLTSVTIPSSITSIGRAAFQGCDNLMEIYVRANTPPAFDGNGHDWTFSETTYQTATLWVPIGTRDSYINADGWSQFFDIREVPYYWSCDFEGEEIWTVGNDQQNGNVQWQIVTPETYPSALISGDNAYIKPFVFQGDTLNDTPEHWAMADLISQSTDLGGPGQVAESSWIEFNNINLIEAEQPQITFRQIFRQLNGVETSIRVSIDGGQTWTDHIVNEEVEDNTYGEYEIRTGIREAAGEGNVTIRFLFNSDAHTTQMGYGWEIDDIEIKEAPDTIIATAGEGGTISPSGEVLVEIGESVTFTITPNDGYRIASVMVDETENVTDQLVDGVYTFENVTASHLIEATFEAIPSFTITVSVNNDAYGSVSGGGTYEEGSEVVITATPNQGYRFVSWSDGHVGNPRTIIVTSDSTFVANFIQIDIDGGIERRNVLVELFAYKNCGYSPYAAAALDNMEAADSLNIIVINHHVSDTYGYTESMNRFYYWAEKDDILGQSYGFDGTPSVVFDGYLGMSGTNTNVDEMQETYIGYYNNVKTINSLYSLNAEFEQTELESRTFVLNVTAEKHSEYFGDDQIVVMAALAEDIDYDWGVAGKINNLVRVLYPDANGTEATFDGNNRFSTSFSITISEEYDISKCKVVVWVENHTQGRVMQSKRFNVMDFYNLQAQQYTITVLSNNDAYGTVSGGGTYDEGSEITLSAMPNQGYVFDSWEDGNFDNPRSIEVTSDSTFIADFVKCEITQTIDTVVPNFVTVGDHTFYSTGNYSFSVLSENDCDTIFDIRLRVLAEPVYDIGPNPTKSLLNINSDGFISAVEFYSVTGQLVMRKEVNGYEAELDVERLMNGVYIVRIYGEESSLPSVSKVVKE